MNEENNLNYIQENLKIVREKVSRAAYRSGRNPDDIKIIAVTKTVEPAKMLKAFECGITDAGENRVQELLTKHEELGSKCNWHFIGHLQKNKVKHIIDKAGLIHSVDSLSLADEINKRAVLKHKTMDILVQVNIAGEKTKFGLNKNEMKEFLHQVSKYSNIRTKGLMTMAPYDENPENIRWVFRELKKLSIDIMGERFDNINMAYLSMGMSNDFEIAVEEGANALRIGSAIFGRRQY